ncbi:Ubiquitin carboxyl-terminal hydrolase 30 homolog [Eumeta japonica]|uniref:ubiquitinyl hydrolase 1 n=1 Tax=Eumeta variegata TaxID=151549 RepID=A0A4C1Z9X9_EUMVA|nr:Ubiquitin carboxyl-terminal hydrolase 30 homolog [Eumeta japonica]
MDSGDRILMAAGLTAAVVVGAFVLWGPGGAPRTRKRRGQIAGLQNLGRTCFLNTLLQALAACPIFIDWLRKYSKMQGNNSMITTLYTVIDVVNGTHETARGTPVCPLGVLQSLRAAGWVVPPDQQDAHELLHVLLSCIEEETQAMAKKPGCLSDALSLAGGRAWSALASPATPPGAPLHTRSDSTPPTPSATLSALRSQEPELIDLEPERDPDPASATLTSGGLGANERGGLQRGVSRSFCHLGAVARRWPAATPRPAAVPPFRGSLASRLDCTVCSAKSPIRYDKFDSISLSMGSIGGITSSFTLTALLRAFTAPERVKGVRCSKCRPADGDDATYTQHIKTVRFGKLPACLCLHIARVQWTEAGLTKRSEFVSFPETLCLDPFTAAQPPKQVDLAALLSGGGGGGGAVRSSVSALSSGASSDERAMYSLVAVVVHVGGPRSGHFATYRRGNGFEAKRNVVLTALEKLTREYCAVVRCAAGLMIAPALPV